MFFFCYIWLYTIHVPNIQKKSFFFFGMNEICIAYQISNNHTPIYTIFKLWSYSIGLKILKLLKFWIFKVIMNFLSLIITRNKYIFRSVPIHEYKYCVHYFICYSRSFYSIGSGHKVKWYFLYFYIKCWILFNMKYIL